MLANFTSCFITCSPQRPIIFQVSGFQLNPMTATAASKAETGALSIMGPHASHAPICFKPKEIGKAAQAGGERAF
jgi:hypothetical protein